MTDYILKELATVGGMLTLVFSFYWRFIRPGVVVTITWRKEMEAQVEKIRGDLERHSKSDGSMLDCLREMKDELHAIRIKIAVLEERSKNWGTS